MEKVPLGQRVRPLGINKVTVADNCKCRAVLIDTDPRMKYLAWDDTRKRRVEVDQDMIIRYGFRPYTAFYYLIARLDTNMKGEVVGDSIVVEYLQLSEKQNNDFADAISELNGFSSLLLTKVNRRNDKGQDLSYVDVKPSTYEIPDSIMSKVEELRATPDAIEGMWQIIDSSTSLSKAQYLKLLEEDGEEVKQVAAPAPRKQISQPRSAVPQAPQAIVDSFTDGEPFDDDFKDM